METIAVTCVGDDGALAQVTAVEMMRSSATLGIDFKRWKLRDIADELDVGWERKESGMTLP